MSDNISQSNQGGPRILLTLKNYHTWATLVKSKLDNINCSKIVVELLLRGDRAWKRNRQLQLMKV
ncbi:hypothetical protein VP01_11257g2 [Puccinia sorghi]|uniref:DUF4219 domain-containing protein n=1 Tax=Puccinia sorghi TaxID=27349 RepID=A0A0L6VS87_9BASI|nr:hypothetical protein VP01_11257g2 [Puccinia sorghi]